MFGVNEYVEITKNQSSHFKVDELVTVCKRVNNAKRDYLFVNPLQGKHIPVSPSKAFEVFQELTDVVLQNMNRHEKIAVVGFAETATAIGYYLALHLPNCIYRTQTTRESIKDAVPCISFEEEHSHAVTQVLYADVEQLKCVDRILFVEDEITTGNTILNFINAIRSQIPHMQFAVASILNWQSVKDAQVFKEKGIDTYYLVRGYLKNSNTKVHLSASCTVPLREIKKTTLPTHYVYTDVCNYKADRLGNTVALRLLDSAQYEKVCKPLIEGVNNLLVLGTEEFMFAGLDLACFIENTYGINVKFHATTRSPITVSNENNYSITKGFKLISAYDTSRYTYVYNLCNEYDKVIIVTDTNCTQGFVNSLLGALNAVGYTNKVEIVKYEGR